MRSQLPGLPAAGGGGNRHACARRLGPATTTPRHSPARGRWLASLLLGAALAASAGRAAADDDGPVEFTEGQYAAYSTLRLANAVVEEKRMFAHSDKAKKDAIAAEFAKACADVGWTKDRFEKVDEAVGSALSALDDPENAGDEVTKTTLATVKAHREELANTDALRQRARQVMQEQELVAKRGAPPTPAQLAGTWVFDFDATVDAMAAGMGEDLKKSARDGLAKSMTAATYTFGPGDRLVATVERPGVPPETQEGTYGLNGSTLTVKARMGSRVREDNLSIGIKDGTLRIGMMGFYSVFRRK